MAAMPRHLPTGLSFIALEALTGCGAATEAVVVRAPFRARPTSCAPGRVLYSGFPACLASCLFVVLAKVVVLFVGLFVMFVKLFVCVFVIPRFVRFSLHLLSHVPYVIITRPLPQSALG